ncbi:NADH-FMN oxidoreductase RutF, flavin reductase (DIM6/NTAB) family [Reichenbachiella faecimaris]|uniref:NADH-FMN oxidoreductase RutF, flavin reductase (DIM6/NTAB) family n=1 Tax=Reichenbachiella faecimaris TaxID=692418 RepID=A0A1W2G7I4_REIFA|nr:flavin reductase family protein [Reichenbachiella faecimaris]SMD32464.1 NADH-FMN oxidoreductase RutF, flavin reductase (DIM6/NTAB) family [Reichenbachiella faecimaris]
MTSIDPKSVSTAHFHSVLLTVVAPRPIAFASTIDENGQVNLSPFSFFNAFSANPPILVFSPARRVRDNTTKHTLENVLKVPEVVINIVDYPIVEQMSLASTEYPAGVNEFVKAGFTEVASEKIKPPRVKESPVAFECKVLEVKSMGDHGGAGNLIICEIVMAHVQDHLLTDENKIDPTRLELVARMGGNWYTKANQDTMFEIPKPLTTMGIGFDQLPDHVRNSPVLTGNNLGRLANVEHLPAKDEILLLAKEPEVSAILENFADDEESMERELHLLAQKYLDSGLTQQAWQVILQGEVL